MEILNLSQYEQVKYSEKPSKGGHINFGEDNLFPQYLVDLYMSSATHNALCNSIAYMIFSEGLVTDDFDAKIKIAEWGLDDEIRKSCLDLKVQGGFALEIIYSLDRTTISKVRHLPFENLRSGDVNDKEKTDFYYYSRDWTNKSEEPQILRSFTPEDAVDYPVQVLYVKPFSLGSFFYPRPDYIGSLNYIELDKEISVFHINNIRNGLAPSFMIHFKNGTPPPEERRKIRSDIETQLAGASNTGKFFITFSDQPDRRPDFEPFPMNDLDKQYQFLSGEVVDKIMVAHRAVSPAMFGIKTSGQLGSTQELEVASLLFDKQVVKPFQRIVNKALKSIFNASGITGVVKLTEPEVIEQREDLKSEENIDGFHSLAHDYLMETGEEISDEWELIDEREVDYDLESAHDSAWAFAKVPSGSKKGKSKQDNSVIRVRYKYAPSEIDTEVYKSRDFCRKMVGAKRIYRKEDIINAGNRAVNKGWGPKGADTYSIWFYKGGGSCAHYWMRQTYLKKSNKKISVNQAKKIIAQLPTSQRKPLPVNDNKVAKRPRDMDRDKRGFLKPKQWTTPV
mgnify:CR=1 FL=1